VRAFARLSRPVVVSNRSGVEKLPSSDVLGLVVLHLSLGAMLDRSNSYDPTWDLISALLLRSFPNMPISAFAPHCYSHSSFGFACIVSLPH
jgi:hypothetical protein